MAAGGRRGSFRDFETTLKALGGWHSWHQATKVLLVYGTSDYLLQLVLKSLKGPSAAAAGHQVVAVEAGALDHGGMASMVGQTSLFEAASCYLIHRCEQAKQLPGILKGLSGPEVLGSHLVFFYRGESPAAPLRSEVRRLGGKELPCFDPWPNELGQAVSVIAGTLGLTLAPDAVRLVAEALGTNLVVINHELTRLAMANPDRKSPLTAGELATDLGMLREDEAFLLDRLLVEGRFAEAQALLDDLLERGESPLALLGILAGHCRNALQVSDSVARGLSAEALMSGLSAPPSVAKVYSAHARRFGRADTYASLISACQAADIRLKSTPDAEQLVLGDLVEALAGARTARQ